MTILKITDVRLCFPDLWKPDEKYDRFGASFPIVPGSPNDKLLTDAIAAAAKEKWGAKSADVLAKLTQEGLLGYIKFPKTNADAEVYDGFQGMYTLNATNKTHVAVIDKDTSPLTQQSGRPYGGCYVDASIDIWAQDNSWGRRINATLRWVQFRRDGDAFSGSAPPSQDEFQSIADGADAGDLL